MPKSSSTHPCQLTVFLTAGDVETVTLLRDIYRKATGENSITLGDTLIIAATATLAQLTLRANTEKRTT